MLLKDKELGQILNKFKTCAPIFIALGDEARQKLIMDIADAGNEGINVTHLSEKSHLSRPAISHHLKVSRKWLIEMFIVRIVKTLKSQIRIGRNTKS